MIIKSADEKKLHITALQGLQGRSDCPPETRKKIEQELRNIQAGIKGEDEAAYEMKVHWGESKNWMVIHDLRIEHGDLVAQIDHLIVNRFLEVWVCESKHFSEGIAINEHGEFAAFFGSKPYGVPSPIEQNNRHVLILKRYFESGAVKLPTRLGFTIKPDLKSLVLVSKHARIARPKAKVDGLDCVIKNDQLFKAIDKAVDGNNNPLMMAKIIGQDTLEAVCRDLARQHKPVTFKWYAKFGLPENPPVIASVPTTVPEAAQQVPQVQPVVQPSVDSPAVPADTTEGGDKPKQKLICASCSAPVLYSVAKFCWFNKPRFGGKVYCMECQKTVQAP
jgi:hypothetical protein